MGRAPQTARAEGTLWRWAAPRPRPPIVVARPRWAPYSLVRPPGSVADWVTAIAGVTAGESVRPPGSAASVTAEVRAGETETAGETAGETETTAGVQTVSAAVDTAGGGAAAGTVDTAGGGAAAGTVSVSTAVDTAGGGCAGETEGEAVDPEIDTAGK